MSKNLTKVLALVLVLVLVFSLAACAKTTPTEQTNTEPTNTETNTETKPEETKPEETKPAETSEPEEPVEEKDLRLARDVYTEYDATQWYDESDALYEEVLGEYYDYYLEGTSEISDMGMRYALMALAEGKLLGSGIFLPLTTQGGSYAMSRVAPYTVNSTMWGNDSDRFHQALIATEFIVPADRNEMKAKWAELRGTGEYEAWAKQFLADKGYELTDTYNLAYSSNPQTWDALNTYRSADSEAIVNTYDGLLEYDIENVQQPALATSYEVSEDGTVYTFHIREGVTWVDSQGRKVADLTADDWVAALQHLLDAQGGLETLAAADGAQIKNAQAYIDGEITDFSQVGVKALDDYTLEYTLEEAVPFFASMLGYNIFAPMSRAYYTSQGGKFGADFDADDENYLYGTDPDHIAYNGPYLVTNATENATIVYKANPSYWNADGINIKTINWLYNDGTDVLKAYNDAVAGTIAGAALTNATLETAKQDGNFDKYAYTSETNATTYCGFLCINRKAYVNYTDATKVQSELTVYDADRSNAALQNVHFRRAVLSAIDRATYNAQSKGEELKLNNVRNMYTPGNFVSLPNDVTVEINGKATTFKAGTYYGEICQAQLDADGVEITVWDPEAEGGIGSSDKFDGWYNPEYAKAELAKAIEELAADGVEITADDPIQIDVPYFAANEIYTNRANVIKKSIETVLEGKVQVNLVACNEQADWLYAGYYPDYGYEMNANFMDVSGWGPDYGDPQTYLATMTPAPGGMVKSCGMY